MLTGLKEGTHPSWRGHTGRSRLGAGRESGRAWGFVVSQLWLDGSIQHPKYEVWVSSGGHIGESPRRWGRLWLMRAAWEVVLGTYVCSWPCRLFCHQNFWHQGPVSWKAIFPWTGLGKGRGDGLGMIQAHHIYVHFIPIIIASASPQIIRH